MDQSAFENLFKKNVPHILEKIFFSLDYESYKASHKVCTAWNQLLSSDFFVQKARKMLTENGFILSDAILREDAKEVKRIIAKGMVDMNYNLGDIYPTFICLDAVRRGNTEILKLLLEGGADPNVADGDGLTPLLFVARRQKYKAVAKLLLDYGANPNKADQVGRTPLHYAVIYGAKEVFQVLLDRGADPLKPDTYGRTPLSWAQNRSHESQNLLHILTMLKDAAANWNLSGTINVDFSCLTQGLRRRRPWVHHQT